MSKENITIVQNVKIYNRHDTTDDSNIETLSDERTRNLSNRLRDEL